MNKIFVNICSYRDKLLAPTILSLIESESGKNKITYGIFEQCIYEDSLEKKYPEIVSNPQVRYKRIDPQYSEGVMWARAINALQIEDEEFQYQIDSHMLFDKDWDHYLVMDYNQASRLAGTDKIILTSASLNYDIYKNVITKHVLDGEVSSKIGYFRFDKNFRLYAHGVWIESSKVVTPAIHICAGNFFAPTKWVKEVGYNPKIFFAGEEQILSLSSFIAGYQMFHQRKIKVYHYLNSSKHTSKQTIDPIDETKVLEREERSIKELIKYIYSIDEEILEKYRKHTGVDYINRKLEERCIARAENLDPGDDNDWEIPNRED
jgi:hypothetical protein